jgi:predicted secreted protein
MSVGIKIAGREVTVTVGGASLVGQLSKNISLNNEPFDTTDDDASGWTELAAEAAVKSLEMGLSGPLKNLELVAFYFGSSQMAQVVWTFPDGAVTGSTITFDAFLSSVSTSGESNEAMTWESSLVSSGVVTFVPGTDV